MDRPLVPPILLYDGNCPFCTRSVELLLRWIGADADVEAWQLADLEALGVPRSQVEQELVWVRGDGRRAGGAMAFAGYLRAARGIWPVLGRVIELPPIRWIAPPLYRLISRHRHRLPGATPALQRNPADRPGVRRHNPWP